MLDLRTLTDDELAEELKRRESRALRALTRGNDPKIAQDAVLQAALEQARRHQERIRCSA